MTLYDIAFKCNNESQRVHPMTEINHRRDGKRHMKHPVRKSCENPRSQYRDSVPTRRGGYFPSAEKPWQEMDMSFFGAGRIDPLVGPVASKGFMGNDFANGKKGMRRGVAGAKKFVNSRIRAKERRCIKELVDSTNDD